MKEKKEYKTSKVKFEKILLEWNDNKSVICGKCLAFEYRPITEESTRLNLYYSEHVHFATYNKNTKTGWILPDDSFLKGKESNRYLEDFFKNKT